MYSFYMHLLFKARWFSPFKKPQKMMQSSGYDSVYMSIPKTLGFLQFIVSANGRIFGSWNHKTDPWFQTASFLGSVKHILFPYFLWFNQTWDTIPGCIGEGMKKCYGTYDERPWDPLEKNSNSLTHSVNSSVEKFDMGHWLCTLLPRFSVGGVRCYIERP